MEISLDSDLPSRAEGRLFSTKRCWLFRAVFVFALFPLLAATAPSLSAHADKWHKDMRGGTELIGPPRLPARAHEAYERW